MTAIAAANHLQRFLRHVARSSDAAMVVLLMVAMAVMILPLPTMLIDALIAWNIGVSVLILIVAIYLPHPLAFSTLPAVILTATLFRLATEVAVTRLILVQVDAGEIVRAFGNFVVSRQLRRRRGHLPHPHARPVHRDHQGLRARRRGRGALHPGRDARQADVASTPICAPAHIDQREARRRRQSLERRASSSARWTAR